MHMHTHTHTQILTIGFDDRDDGGTDTALECVPLSLDSKAGPDSRQLCDIDWSGVDWKWTSQGNVNDESHLPADQNTTSYRWLLSHFFNTMMLVVIAK